MILRRLLLAIFVVGLVVFGDSVASSSDDKCDFQLLSLSAFNRAANIRMLLTLRNMLLEDTYSESYKYTQKVLAGEVVVAKTILLQMTFDGQAVQSLNEFEKSAVSKLMYQLLEKDIKDNVVNYQLPKKMQDRLGNEGLSLFSALYRYVQLEAR
ncbi:MAG: hypothetical protein ABW170_10605 [Candidatus Thiodiazotropha sp. L084R]